MTPPVLLGRLVSLFPEFRHCWDDPGNLFRQDDGTFTLHSVFIEFSHFFREHFSNFTDERVSGLGAFVSECMSSNDGDLENAAATCFIENIANEKCGEELAQHLTGEAKTYWQAWAE